MSLSGQQAEDARCGALPVPTGYQGACALASCSRAGVFISLSLRPGTGEHGMAQPAVIEHVGCRLLQRYCSSLFITSDCSWIQRTNFLACGCLLVLPDVDRVGRL